ncbi:MAG: anti-sigma factor antagonist, partial [Ruminococcus sp.]
EITLQDRTLVAVLDGEIDHHCAQPMRTEIDEKITAYQPEVLVLDFAGVTFMDSSGIGLIMGRHRSMESIGGEVIVRNPPQHIRRVMRLSGMERIARIQMDAPAAWPEEPAERRDEQ